MRGGAKSPPSQYPPLRPIIKLVKSKLVQNISPVKDYDTRPFQFNNIYCNPVTRPFQFNKSEWNQVLTSVSGSCFSRQHIQQVVLDKSSDFSDIVQLDRHDTFEENSVLDGNEVDSASSEEEHKIPVIIGVRPDKEPKEETNSVRKIIKRNGRGNVELFVPNVAVYNHRSVWSKYHSMVTEAKYLKLGISLHSEIWEVKEKKEH